MRVFFRSAAMAALAVAAGGAVLSASSAAEAATLWTITGTVTDGSANGLNLFGGGDLTGQSFSEAIEFTTAIGLRNTASVIDEIQNDVTGTPALMVSMTINGSTVNLTPTAASDFLLLFTPGIRTAEYAATGVNFDTGGELDADEADAPNYPASLDDAGFFDANPIYLSSGFFNVQGPGASTLISYSADHFVASVVTAPVPEPATWATMILGLGMLGGLARRRRQVAMGSAPGV